MERMRLKYSINHNHDIISWTQLHFNNVLGNENAERYLKCESKGYKLNLLRLDVAWSFGV